MVDVQQVPTFVTDKDSVVSGAIIALRLLEKAAGLEPGPLWSTFKDDATHDHRKEFAQIEIRIKEVVAQLKK